MILLLNKDLLAQSQFSSAAKRLGMTFKSVSQLDVAINLISNQDADNGDAVETVEALIVDLQTPGLSVADLIAELKQIKPRPYTIAFAQHVKVDLLESVQSNATEAAEVIDSVLTRGQVMNGIPKILQQLGEAEPRL